MTYRLVGLMSIVLLLSLAAFALLISHVQGQVMGELAQTASAIGRATLETLESHRATVVDLNTVPAAAGRPEGEAGTRVERAREDDGGGTAGNVFMFSTLQVPAGSGESVVVVRRPGEAPRRIPLDEISDDELRELAPGLQVHRGDGPGGEVTVEVEHFDARPSGEGTAAGGGAAGNAEDERRVVTVVRLDDIRTVEEPGKGLFLTIPAFSAEGSGNDPTFEMAWAQESTAAAPGGSGFRIERDFRVEVPTDDYRTLFARMRRRSGFVFLGVFLVGTALSAAVATRFTRPVRRLDGAIHRLSEGDLDARVDVRGRDELARLGRAFNSMAHKLRVGRERADDLARREKLSALGRLAAGVAHDVRNPLHSIGLSLQHLQEACAPETPERRQDFDRSLAIIRGEIHRLDKLVSSFLHFARSDRRERAPVDLVELAREVARLVEKEAERRGIEVRVEAEDDTPPLPADAGSIRASILNLVLNGFDAMPEGGTVTLRVSARGADVSLEVVDTGCGIPEGEQDKVFDFSYTTREGGHGLGLAMVHHVVVEEHGGRIALDSAPGRGTRVSLVFPREVAEKHS